MTILLFSSGGVFARSLRGRVRVGGSLLVEGSPLRLKRGDTPTLEVGPVMTTDGVVPNIYGFILRFTAKDRIADLDAAALIAALGVVDNGAAGLAHVTIPKAATEGFTADRALHGDLQIADPASGMVSTLWSGKLLVQRDVTRASP